MQGKEVASSMLMLVLSVAFWFAADAIARSPLEGQISAAGFPKLLAIGLGVLVIIRLLQLVLAERRARSSGQGAAMESPRDSGAGEDWRQHRRAAGMIAIGIAYVVVLSTLGYLLSIGLLLAAVALYSGRRPSIGLAAVSIAGAGFLYVMFVQLLGVPLPSGVWEGLLAGSR